MKTYLITLKDQSTFKLCGDLYVIVHAPGGPFCEFRLGSPYVVTAVIAQSIMRHLPEEVDHA